MKYYQQIDRKMRIECNSLQKKLIYSEGEMELERHVSESQSPLQEIVGFRQVLSCFCCYNKSL